MLKVITNYLATANLISLSEALVKPKIAGMDLVLKDMGLFQPIAKQRNVPLEF